MHVQDERDKQFADECVAAAALFHKKNSDYNDDYFVGDYSAMERWMSIRRKVARLESFYKNGKFEVEDETVDDTLRDLAIYCFMELIKRKINAGGNHGE